MEHITAEQLINLWQTADIKVVLINLIVFIAGALANTYKQMKTENITFVKYWRTHSTRSFASIITLIASFVALLATGAAPLYAYFSIAYMSDSVINKAPRTQKNAI